MSKKIKFPKNCTDQELKQILSQDDGGYVDFPFSVTDNRFLSILDYKEESLRRKQHEVLSVKNPGDEILIQFMDKLAKSAPYLYEALIASIRDCRQNHEPTPLLFSYGNTCEDFDSRRHAAKISVRAAVKKLTRQTLVATSPNRLWLLPESVDAYEWVQKKTGFLTLQRVQKLYPRASAILEYLAKVAYEQSERYAMTKVDDLENLRQVVEVLAVYPHYFSLEESYRVAFALVPDNRVVARTIFSRPEAFLRLTSPNLQLEIWNSQPQSPSE